MATNVGRIFLPVYPRVVLFFILVIVVLIFMLVRVFPILIGIFLTLFIQTVLEPRGTVEDGDAVGTKSDQQPAGSGSSITRRG